MSVVTHIRYIDEYNKQRALLTDSYPSFVCTAACNAIVEEELAKLEPRWVTDPDPDAPTVYTLNVRGAA